MSTPLRTQLDAALEKANSPIPARGTIQAIKHSPTHWEYVYEDGRRIQLNPQQSVKVKVTP